MAQGLDAVHQILIEHPHIVAALFVAGEDFLPQDAARLLVPGANLLAQDPPRFLVPSANLLS